MASPTTKLVCWTSLTLSDHPADQHLTWWQSASSILLRPQFMKVFKHIHNFQVMQLLSWYPAWQWFWDGYVLRCWVIVVVDGQLCPSHQCVGKFIKMNENKVVGSTFKTFFITLMSLWPKKTGSLQLNVFMFLRGHLHLKIRNTSKTSCLFFVYCNSSD